MHTSICMRIQVSNNPEGPLGLKEGVVLLEIHPSWAPLGAKRFFNLVSVGKRLDE